MAYDFIQLFRDYGIDYNSNINEGWVNVDCPICHHHGSRGYKGGFNLAGGYFHCWACGGHHIDEAIAALLGIPRGAAGELLFKYQGHVSLINVLNKRKPKASKIELPGSDLQPMHRRYLEKRGFNCESIIEKYHIQGTDIVDGDWGYRIMIPIYFKNRLVSYQGRSILSKNRCTELGILRYKTLSVEKSVMDPKHLIYNIDHCLGDTIVLVEGVFDCWRLGDGFGATLGTSMSEEQLYLVANNYKHVVLLFDNEQEAQERAEKEAISISSLGKHPDVDILNPEFEHDPGSYTVKEVRAVKKELGMV